MAKKRKGEWPKHEGERKVPKRKKALSGSYPTFTEA
jgi:hypothetical protein